MNIFVIPSWYPSENDALPGIFFKEQSLALARNYPELNIGISTWGQNDDRLLLLSNQPIKSLTKLFRKPISAKQQLEMPNVVEYFQPEFTWSSMLFHGNLGKIVKANLTSLKEFKNTFGKVDIIHAHVGFPAGYIAKKLAEIYKIPYVLTEHMSPFPHQHLLTREKGLTKQLLEAYGFATKIISVSNSLKDQMTSFGIQNITTIANTIDESFFKPASPVRPNEKFTFFSLARLVPQKGIDLLLKAFAKLKTNARLRIGGDGEFKDTYQKMAADFGIAEKVTWLGEIDKQSALSEYQRCDAFVLPSRHESMGVVFAEAMACGKPVIATICGGPEEFVNESNGYLIPAENESKLVSAMENIVTNHHTFDPVKIRTLFEDRFSSRIVCKQLMEVYQDVIQTHKSF